MRNFVTSTEPLVSIDMPVYNGEEYIAQTIDSLLSQDTDDFEIVISDNASTDRTSELCAEYVARDERVRYFRNDTNIGAVANFDLVLALARGKYFAWSSHNDIWDRTYLRKLLAGFANDVDAVLSASGVAATDEHGNFLFTYPAIFELVANDKFERLRRYLSQPEHLGKANIIYGVMRRDAVLKAGGFKFWNSSVWGKDMLLIFRLLSLGNLVVCNETLFYKRGKLEFVLVKGVELKSFGDRVHFFKHLLDERAGYFLGCHRVIQLVDDLAFLQKIRLHLVVLRRATEMVWGQLDSLFFRYVASWLVYQRNKISWWFGSKA